MVSADDVIQVTFLEAFLRIGQFRGRSFPAFMAWLTRSAENNLRDAIRELRAVKRPPPTARVSSPAGSDVYSSFLGLLAGTGTTPTGHASRQDVKSAIDDAMADLPDVYARVVRDYDLLGHTIAEVSKTVGKSLAAVHMIRVRAYDRLRELLGDPGRFFSADA